MGTITQIKTVLGLRLLRQKRIVDYSLIPMIPTILNSPDGSAGLLYCKAIPKLRVIQYYSGVDNYIVVFAGVG